MPERDVIVVGGGPAGLAAAIACQRRGLSCEVLEKGVLVNSIYRFPPHMVFFTTPELLEIGGMPLVSPFDKPTRIEALRYYRRVADALKLPVTLGETVERVEAGEGGLRTFSTDAEGQPRVWRSRGAVLAIGYYDHPNRLGVPGEDLPHVSHYYSEAHPFYRKRVVVVGGANSAAEAALDLYRSGASVTLVHRRAELSETIKYWVLPDIQNRIKEGAVAARLGWQLTEITAGSVVVERDGSREELPADAVLLLTGYHPDRDFLARCGVGFEPETCLPMHDRDTYETNVPNVFLAGGVISDARSHPIFIENGRHHGERAVEVIASRLRA
ncbi:MAG TPA: YpdA family putative bacillithiol disulfide reductase [Vicinamibacterales bacterium]|nr:YpdA family putative bacillithiol disulfide reductase [Vicinamibacterales bacterium]